MGSGARTASGLDRRGHRTHSGYISLRGMRQASPSERREHDDEAADDQDEISEQDLDGQELSDYENLEVLLRLHSVQHVDRVRIKRFWPIQVLDRVLTRDRVIAELKTYEAENPQFRDRSLLDELTENILLRHRKIFAILVLIGKGPFIEAVVEENLQDKHLPLRTRGASRQLYQKGHKLPEKCFNSHKWMTYQREIFSDLQYAVNPVILGMEADGRTPRHEDFPPKIVLPFIHEKTRHEGGYGLVTEVKIHPDCHHFHNVLGSIKTNDSFAIKQLAKQDKTDFQREVDALKRFNGLLHDHLVTLLMTWTLQGRYHFLFPLAKCDLEEYWEDHPRPLMDPSTVHWMSRQIVGLAGALHTIHEPPSNRLDTLNINKYGRHGDLKPENILLYDSPSDPKGILVIADLGLTKLNSILSRSNESINRIHATPRYKPPECDIEPTKISRSYDMWTFGCVLLEWMCWALNGQANRVQFLYSLQSPYLTGAHSDVFYDFTVSKTGGYQLIVKSKVFQLIKELHLDAKCTQYFHDLLDLIQKDMIVIRAQERISSSQLHQKLTVIDQKLQRDEDYCTAAYSRPWLAESQLPLDIRLKRKHPLKADSTVSIHASDTRLPRVHDDNASGTLSSWIIGTPSSGLSNQSQRLHQPEENLMRTREHNSTSNDIMGIGDRFETATSPWVHSFSSNSQRSSPPKFPVIVNAVEGSILRSQEDTLTAQNWRSIWARLPAGLQDVIEYERVSGGMPCWTCYPKRLKKITDIPLAIAGAPVVIPVIYQIPLRGGVAPPKDPFPNAISPCISISEATAEAIFEQFPAAIGFYLLLNGFLQLLVPSDFDLEDAYDNLPTRFGGLKVSYVREDAYPRPTHNSETTPMSNLAPIRVGSLAVARPEVTRGEPKTKRAKMGVKTRANGHTYMTVSTHLITKTLLGNNMGISLDNFKKVQIYSDNGLQIGTVFHCFDQDVLGLPDRPFPLGFEHDTSLVRIVNQTTTQEFKAPPDTDWLPKDEFIRLQYYKTKICFLEDQATSDVLAKNIPLGESGSLCSIVGQALFRAHQDKKKTNHPLRQWWHNLFTPKTPNDTYNAFVPFKTAVKRSLLYRVSPPFEESGGESGRAVCVVEPGDTKLKILGFQSFAQDVVAGCMQYYSEEEEEVIDGIKEDRVAFYGAFPVPEDIINEHEICT